MTTATQTRDQLTVSAPELAGAAIPYLAVSGGRAAIDWYVRVFGAELLGDPIVMPDGRIGHAELALAGGKLYLADEFPEIGVVAPSPDAAAVSLVLAVSDVDARVADATAAGGRLTREIAEAYGSRNATIVDPFGHRWMLQQPVTSVPAGESPPPPWRQGDLAYVSLWTRDLHRAEQFYSAVLGWRYEPAHTDQGVRVVGQSMSMGIVQDPLPGLYGAYTVGDVDAAAARVRAAGGTAEPPAATPYGRMSECTDPAGTRFSVYTPAPDHPSERPPRNGALPGDLAYVSYEVVDSAAARDFFTAVFGWEFTPGRVEDGWQLASDVAPMRGFGGGADRSALVPMWLVTDIGPAVERVRAAGGVAAEVSERPYGLESLCSDDQGMAFYLGQLE